MVSLEPRLWCLATVVIHFFLSSKLVSGLPSARRQEEEIRKELIKAQSFLEVLRILHPEKSSKEAWNDLLKEREPKIDKSEKKVNSGPPIKFAAMQSPWQNRRMMGDDAESRDTRRVANRNVPVLSLFNGNLKSIEKENSGNMLNQKVYDIIDGQSKKCSRPVNLTADVRTELGLSSSYNMYIYPECLTLQKCSKEAGCCSKTQSCMAIKRHTVQKWVYIRNFGTNSEKLSEKNFTEDVECGCRSDHSSSRLILPSCNRKCPKKFELVKKRNECSCHCIYSDDSYLCKQIYKGRKKLEEGDCSCIERGDCNSPSCAPGLEFDLETCKCQMELEKWHGDPEGAENTQSGETSLIDDEDFAKDYWGSGDDHT